MIEIAAICQEGIAEWQATGLCKDLSKWQMSGQEQLAYEIQMDQFLNDLIPYMEAFPKQKSARTYWKKKGERYINDLMKKEHVVFISDMDEHSRTLFQEITLSFLKDVRTFDSSLSLEDAMQALRNVWIIAILQCIFGKETGYHQAMFAYSMLYPYSDNYLDDVNVAMAEKQSFNAWFTARLKGELDQGRNVHEEKISALVGMIEDQFPRAHYASVYESLLLIQDAQVDSLQQQDGKRKLNEEELLAISYRKGGTSVVADGFLIEGSLSSEEIMFCMRYGFMLQLGDDLQDVVSDREHHHQTLLAVSEQGEQDEFVEKLIQYTIDILQPSSICSDQPLLEFVTKDCLYLLFLALAQETERSVSMELYQTILSCLPVTKAYMEEKRKDQLFSLTEEQWWERIDTLLLEVN